MIFINYEIFLQLDSTKAIFTLQDLVCSFQNRFNKMNIQSSNTFLFSNIGIQVLISVLKSLGG